MIYTNAQTGKCTTTTKPSIIPLAMRVNSFNGRWFELFTH